MYIIFTIMIFITTAIIVLVFKISAALSENKPKSSNKTIFSSHISLWGVVGEGNQENLLFQLSRCRCFGRPSPKKAVLLLSSRYFSS